MKTIVTQNLKWHLRGCLSRDEVYRYLDTLWKPNRFFKNRKVSQFVDWLHRDRISLNRIITIETDFTYLHSYVIHVWYYTRRGNERYSAYYTRR